MLNIQVQKILDFTKENPAIPKAQYFKVGGFEIYVRNTSLYLGHTEDSAIHVLVIANIVNHILKERGTGGLHKLLDILEPQRNVSFECVHNARLRAMLQSKRMYLPVPGMIRSFLKPLTSQHGVQK